MRLKNNSIQNFRALLSHIYLLHMYMTVEIVSWTDVLGNSENEIIFVHD